MPIVFQSEAGVGQEDSSVLDEERERHRKRYQSTLSWQERTRRPRERQAYHMLQLMQ